MDTLQKPLKNLGFTDKEIEIYTTLLELGAVSYTELAKATGIKRTTLYTVVNKMHERGITTYEVDTGKISAIAPEKLFSLLQANTLQLHELLPQLNELSKKQRSISRIQFYLGIEGIKRAYLEGFSELPPKKERKIFVLGDAQAWNKFWQEADPHFTDEYIAEMKRKSYHVQLLMTGSSEPPYSQAWMHQRELKMTLKFLPADYKSEFDMEIRPGFIIITDLKSEQPYAIKIISTELAKALGSFFEFSWNQYQ